MPNIKNILIIVPVIALFWVWNVYGRTPAAPLTTLAATNLHTLSAGLADTKADAAETTSTQSQTTKPVNAIVVTGDADLKPENIKKDVQLFGVTGTLLDRGTVYNEKTFTPKKEEQAIDEGYHQGSKIEGDADLKAENIKKDVQLFGVTGTLLDRGTPHNKTFTPKKEEQTIDEGYHQGSKIVGDANLKPENIKKGVSIFGVEGTYVSCEGKLDGTRWCDNQNGTVTDLTTGLIWLKKADWGGKYTWHKAFERASSLKHHAEGADLHDHSKEGDWRLPTRSELEGLANGNEAVRSNSMRAFSGVQPDDYWSSSAYSDDTYFAWSVHLEYGFVSTSGKPASYYVWPVRGGQ